MCKAFLLLMTSHVVSCHCYAQYLRNNIERPIILASSIRLPALLVLKTLKELPELLLSRTFMQSKVLMPIETWLSSLRLVYQVDKLKFTRVLPSILGSLFSPLISYYP